MVITEFLTHQRHCCEELLLWGETPMVFSTYQSFAMRTSQTIFDKYPL